MNKAIQSLDDYVWNLGDKPRYYEWANGSASLGVKHPYWTTEQLEAVSFKQVFPELALPSQFEPKP